MAFDVVGKLHVAYETKQVSARFTKREFVVEIEDGKYPQMIMFQLSGDRCAMLDNFRVGDQVRVTFNVRGREWKSPQGETKYFNSLDVWKLEVARAGADDGRRGGRPPARDEEWGMRDDPRPHDLVGATREDDLPF
ncbi:MAG: DUF3127 domain-containing protein [Kofleriaceae bacterium]